MDTKTIFVLTSKGEDEVAHKSSLLYGDIKRALSMIDGVSTFAEISKRAAPSLRAILAELIKELLTGGFIQDKARAGFSAKIVVPTKPAPTAALQAKLDQSDSELDFTTIMRAPSADILRAEAAKIQAEQLAKQQAEQLKQKTAQEAAHAKELAEAERVRKARAYEAQAKAAEIQARQEAEARAKQQVEARVKKEAEERARKEAEERARKEAEERTRKEAEALARKEAEERARKEAEERARKEAEERARKEAEERARKEAEERARKEAEERARKEAEALARKEAEERARKEAAQAEEAEKKARAHAESERLQAEQAKQALEITKQKAEVEAARLKADVVKTQEEAERLKKEAALAAAQAKEEAERLKKEAALATAQAKEEAERLKKEAALAAAQAKEEAERLKKEAALAAAKAKEEAVRIKKEVEAQAKALEAAARKAQEEEAALAREREAARVREELEAARRKIEQEEIDRAEAETAQLLAEHVAAQALFAAEQQKLKELENLATQAREEEKIRAKQLALAAASTQIRDTTYDTSKPSTGLKLDAIDLDALEIKPDPTVLAHISEADVLKAPVPQGPSAEELKAKEEALKQQAKKAEEARLAEEAVAKKLADAQAKAWAEAEQRAAQAAKAHVEHLAQQSAHNVQAKQQQEKKLQAALKKRKPFPWGAAAAAVLVLVVLALFIVPMTLPTRHYADKLELLISAKIGQPVHIGKLSVRILPTPLVELGEVYIGKVKQIKAQTVQLDFDFGALLGGVKRVNKIELQGGELNSSGLLTVPAWLQLLAADESYPISQIAFSGLKFSAVAVQFNDLEGVLNFSSKGKVDSAVFHANQGRYNVTLKAATAGKYATTFNLHKSALPLLPNWVFDDLSAQGELTQDGLTITGFDSRIAGGVLQGDAKLDWKHGWSAQGSLNAKTISLSHLNKLLEGDMDGVGRFKMGADNLANLGDSASLEGTLIVTKGQINGVDLVETARLHSKNHLPGGRTHFDQLESNLSYSDNTYHFRSVKVTNSVMSATGNIDVAKQQLSGYISTRLSITEGMGSVELQLAGATDNPNLRVAR